jgi:hypothetical protein
MDGGKICEKKSKIFSWEDLITKHLAIGEYLAIGRKFVIAGPLKCVNLKWEDCAS